MWAKNAFLFVIIVWIVSITELEALNSTFKTNNMTDLKPPQSVNSTRNNKTTVHSGILSNPSNNKKSTKTNSGNQTKNQVDIDSTQNVPQHFHFNSGATLRAFYVTLGISSLILIYFFVRAVRLRRKSKLRKYGIIAKKEDMEMTPLDQEDEEDDNTVFDAQDLRK